MRVTNDEWREGHACAKLRCPGCTTHRSCDVSSVDCRLTTTDKNEIGRRSRLKLMTRLKPTCRPHGPRRPCFDFKLRHCGGHVRLDPSKSKFRVCNQAWSPSLVQGNIHCTPPLGLSQIGWPLSCQSIICDAKFLLTPHATATALRLGTLSAPTAPANKFCMHGPWFFSCSHASTTRKRVVKS